MKIAKALRSLQFMAAAMGLAVAGLPVSQAEVTINIGTPPVCPYGYYDYAPYACAPYGYYGPEWFINGVFIGAGPWFHGPANFQGHVNNRLDPRRGYHGAVPQRGARPDPAKRVDKVSNFRANETRDGRGHVVPERQSR